MEPIRIESIRDDRVDVVGFVQGIIDKERRNREDVLLKLAGSENIEEVVETFFSPRATIRDQIEFFRRIASMAAAKANAVSKRQATGGEVELTPAQMHTILELVDAGKQQGLINSDELERWKREFGIDEETYQAWRREAGQSKTT